MLDFIGQHVSIISTILSLILFPAVAGIIKLFWNVKENTKDIARIKKDLAEHKQCNETEINDIKNTMNQDIKSIRESIMQIACSIAKIEGYIEARKERD
jgi:septal ring factor EnvC (AmiA/AmiB activator)